MESTYYYQPAWVMAIIILSVLITGYLFSAFHQRFITILKSFFTMRFANQLTREEYSLTHPASVFLSLSFLLTCSLVVLQIISSGIIFTTTIEFSLFSFILIMASVFLIYFIKIMSIKMLAFIFDKQQLANEYIFTIFLINQIMGILYIPIIIFIAYGSELLANASIYAGTLLLILSFIIRMGKGIMAVLSGGGIALFYLFLYLCTLEILPLLIGFKLLEERM